MARIRCLIEPVILESNRLPYAEEATEIVQRKGLGHPDTICDAVMERVAVELAQAYIKNCGGKASPAPADFTESRDKRGHLSRSTVGPAKCIIS